MTVKVSLNKGVIGANNKEFDQKYELNFLPKVIDDGKVKYIDKIELSISTDRFLSLRFDDPAQLHLLVLDLVKAEFYFRNQKDLLNDFNSGYFHADYSRKIQSIIKDIRKGD